MRWHCRAQALLTTVIHGLHRYRLLVAILVAAGAFFLASGHAVADGPSSSCSGLQQLGSRYFLHCTGEDRRGKGNLDTNFGWATNVPADVDPSQAKVESAFATDGAEFSGPWGTVTIRAPCSGCQGGGLVNVGFTPTPGSSFGFSAFSHGPHGYTYAEINISMPRKAGTVFTSCTASPNPVTLANSQATTTLTGIGSDSWGGEISQYQWDFGDGTTGVSAADPPLRIAADGSTATDRPPLAEALVPPAQAAGGPGGGPPPSVSFTANPSAIVAGESSTLTWSASGTEHSSFTITAANSLATKTATLSFPSGTVTMVDGPGDPSQAFWDQIWQWLGFVVDVPQISMSYQTDTGGPLQGPGPVAISWSVTPGSKIMSDFFSSTGTYLGARSGSERVIVLYMTVTSNFLPSTPVSGSQVVTPTVSTLYSVTATDLNGTTTAYAPVSVNRPPINHTYTQAGTYTVTATATSSSGNTGSGSCTVTVTGATPGAVTIDPLSPSCIVDTGQTRVLLSWSAASGATSYTITRTMGGTATQFTTSQTSYTDTLSAPPGVAYSYQVNAVNSSGSTPSGNSVSGTTNCPATLSLRLSPASIPLPGALAGSATVFTVIPKVNGQDVSVLPIVGGQLSISWRAGTDQAGTVTQSSSNPFQATYVAGSTADEYANAVIATVTLTPTIGSPITKEVTASVVVAGPGGVLGDVYSGGSVSNLVVDPKSVVSANGAIADTVTGTSFKIPGYTTSNSLSWPTARSAILAQARSLKAEHITTTLPTDHVLANPGSADFTLTGSFNLNPPVSNGSANPTTISDVNRATPEGQVWYVAGNLTIDASSGPVTFYGRGTIIVDGLVTLRGSHAIRYPSLLAGSAVTAPPDPTNTASLGIILTDARGEGVAIEPTVTSFVGAYFAAGRVDGTGGTIDVQQPASNPTPIVATGLFVGPSIHLGRPIGSIRYDARVGTLTPPGFGVVTLPGIKETAP